MMVSSQVHDKTVLITGAGGTIGSTLAHYIARQLPKKLWLLNHNELALHNINTGIHSSHPEVDTSLILADVQDRVAMIRLGDKCRPDIVIHAAAVKHVGFAEDNVLQAVSTNILGTQNVLHGCWMAEQFVLISTDKAVCPTTIMGATKRAAEIVVHRHSGIVIRLCNVYGSSGSIIPLFHQQLKDGVPLTVTHEDMERSFIRNEDVVWLMGRVLKEVSWAGKVFSIPPAWTTKIYELAKEVGEAGNATIEIIGLRPGEKIKEDLFAPWETPVEVDGMLVSTSEKPDLHERAVDNYLNDLYDRVQENDVDGARVTMAHMVPEAALPDGLGFVEYVSL